MNVMRLSGKYVKFAVYLIVVVLANVVGLTLFFRADLTANKVYSISAASREAVATLSEPLTINVFFTRNLPAPHNNTERYLHDLLEEYAYYGNRFFNYRFFDVNPDEGDVTAETKRNQDLAKDYGIFPVQIQAIEKDEVKFMKAYMGLVLIHGDIIEKIPTVLNTDGLEYQLTTAIRKLNNKVSALLALPEKVRVELYLSSSLNGVAKFMRLEDLPQLPDRVREIVERVNRKSYGKLDFVHRDPSADAALEADALKHKLMSLNWPALSNGQVPPGKGIIGLVMTYQEKAVTIPLIHVFKIPLIGTQYQLTETVELEELVNNSLEALIDINENLGVLADLGAIDLSGEPPQGFPGQPQTDSQKSFKTLASQNYSIKNVELKKGAIPAGLKTLVIPGPTETFSDYELFQIDQFLMQGKSLAIFLDAFNEVFPGQAAMGQQGPVYLPLDTGLEKLLAHYGVRINRSLVLDENCFKQKLPEQMGGGERPVYFAPLLRNRDINNEPTFMRNIKGMVTVKASPLSLDAERLKANGLTATRLLSSSERSWEMTGQINLNPMFIRPPQDATQLKAFPLAYLLEGEFSSYFEGKAIPERVVEKEAEAPAADDAPAAGQTPAAETAPGGQIASQGKFLSRGRPGKIFLMASTEMIKDNVIGEEGRSPNEVFIMNLIDHLNGRDDIAVMRSKEQRFNPLDETSAAAKTLVKAFNIAGLPVLVVLFGLAVWWRRHTRKKRLQLMFQK